MSPGLSVFILVVLLVVGWFALGTHLNVRKGHNVLRWLQEGLPVLGEKTTLRWLGSSVVELKLQQAKPPFRQAEVLVVLEPRDVPPLWWLARLRGRRDLFIFRANLRQLPQREFVALDTASWSNRGEESRLRQEQWQPQAAPAPLAAYAPQAAPAAGELMAAATLDGCPLVRLSVRRSEPNLEAQWRLDPLLRHPARAVLEVLRRVAERS